MRSTTFRSAFLLLILFSYGSFASGQDSNHEKIFHFDENGYAEVCILNRTYVDAHYKFAPNIFRGKDVPQTSRSEINISYVNDCGGETWPDGAINAFEFAADIWESHLESSVPIKIQANWVDLGSNTLGSAGPTTVFGQFNGGLPNTWYTIAQASAMTGRDLAAENDIDFDVIVNMNCNFDDWYFPTDANPPAGTLDAVTVLVHEIGHGIGFTGSMNADPNSQLGGWGIGSQDWPLVFDVFTLDGSFDNLINLDLYSKPSMDLYDALTGQFGGVFFSGLEAEYTLNNNRIPLYTPRPYVPGSSYSHLDQQFFTNTENALMRPQLDQALAIHSPGPVFCGILKDMGWPLGPACMDLIPEEGFLNRPLLTFPENGSFNSSRTPTLMWQEVAGAEEYRIQLAGDYEFDEIIVDEVVSGTSFSVEQILNFDTLFFWRVQALGVGGNSKFSSKYRFTTTNAPPESIVLLQPDDDSVNLRPGFSFVWQEAGRANEYQIQVATSMDFSEPIIDATVTAPRFLNTGNLAFSTIYYWRVRGINSTGAGAWSDIRTFTTIIEKPGPVVLSFPTENENQVSVTATLNWQESERASEYIIQISPNERFTSNTIIQLTSNEAMVTLNEPLEFATIYYWRVKATNIGGESEWSDIEQFTTVVRETAIMPNYPNPFNTTTTIRFQLAETSDVTLDVFDTAGRRVSLLINEERPAGVYFEQIQASGFASGTYFIRIIAGDFMEVQKMALIK